MEEAKLESANGLVGGLLSRNFSLALVLHSAFLSSLLIGLLDAEGLLRRRVPDCLGIDGSARPFTTLDLFNLPVLALARPMEAA